MHLGAKHTPLILLCSQEIRSIVVLSAHHQ
jgi:hypothetical protein